MSTTCYLFKGFAFYSSSGYNEFMNTLRIGERISELRKALGLSGEELGKRAGLTQGFISAVERGAKSPSMTTLTALANALDRKSVV